MIAISTQNGILRIQAEIPIPSAPAGQWSPERIAKLTSTIQQTVEIAELVDKAEREVEQGRAIILSNCCKAPVVSLGPVDRCSRCNKQCLVVYFPFD